MEKGVRQATFTPTEIERDMAEFLHTVRHARQVNYGMLLTSIFFVHAMLRRISMQLRNTEPPDLPPAQDNADLCHLYRMLLQESLLFHHSVLGPMHVQKKTLVDSEASLFKNCKIYLDMALATRPHKLRRVS